MSLHIEEQRASVRCEKGNVVVLRQLLATRDLVHVASVSCVHSGEALCLVQFRYSFRILQTRQRSFLRWRYCSCLAAACMSIADCLSAANAPSLKTQIRELYKRVHPDKFHGFPPARDANEKSFKMLQEYLAAGGHFSQCRHAC